VQEEGTVIIGLWFGVTLGVLLLIRFVHPAIVHRARDVVTRARINRAFLGLAEQGRTDLSRKQFGQLLGHAFCSEGASGATEAMEFRCLKLRELFGVWTTNEFEERAHSRVGRGLAELGDMVSILGHRFRPARELRSRVVEASEILAFIANKVDAGASSDPNIVEQWLSHNALSVGQVGEILIAALFALTCREEGAGPTLSETPIPPAPRRIPGPSDPSPASIRA
jgi:hypothetical protein